MKKKQWEAYLYSIVGVVAMFFAVVGFNAITGLTKMRVDLTQEGIYTLSQGTRAILDKLDTPVIARFYCTQVEDATPETVYLLNYARQVEDLLDELAQASRGRIKVEKYDPQPDSDAEDSAKLNGIEGQPMGLYGEPFYLGVSFGVLDEKEPIPFLTPSRERLLEYDLMRAISRVIQPVKPVVGVMSALPIFGQPANPMMMQMGQQGQEPWIYISELKKDFEVREIPMTTEAIDADLNVLAVIYPKDITEAAQYALDQFVLRGGKLIAFIDPMSVADNTNPGMNALQRATAGGSDLPKLLAAWGVEYDMSKVVSDPTYKTRVGGRGGQPQENPAVLSLSGEALNDEDTLTSQLNDLLMPFPGAFTGTPAEGLTQTVLIKTTDKATLIDRVMAQFGGADRESRPEGKPLNLAIRLTGKFKTAFPDGKPGSSTDGEGGEEGDAGSAASLKESAQENSVVLVADSDILFDPVVARAGNILGMRFIEPLNHNLNFGQSLVELMAGDSDLIAVRSRASLSRPFTVMKQMEQEAQDAYRGKIRDLEESLQEAQQRLNELQRAKQTTDQRFVLSQEQQDELVRFREKEAEVKKELKTVRKNLRKDIDSLENRLKWVNIAGMPFLVTFVGLSMAIYKRKKTAAK